MTTKNVTPIQQAQDAVNEYALTIVMGVVLILYAVGFAIAAIASFTKIEGLNFNIEEIKNFMNSITAAISAIVVADLATANSKTREPGIFSQNLAPTAEVERQNFIGNVLLVIWGVLGGLSFVFVFIGKDTSEIFASISDIWLGVAIPAIAAYRINPSASKAPTDTSAASTSTEI